MKRGIVLLHGDFSKQAVDCLIEQKPDVVSIHLNPFQGSVDDFACFIDENEDLIITDLTVTKQSENVIKLVQKDQFINLVVKNTPDGSGDDEPVLDGKVVIDITKVNKA